MQLNISTLLPPRHKLGYITKEKVILPWEMAWLTPAQIVDYKPELFPI